MRGWCVLLTLSFAIGSIDAFDFGCKVDGVVSGKAFSYAVVASNAVGSGLPSAPRTHTLVSAPSPLNATLGAGGSVTLAWGSLVWAQSYIVTRTLPSVLGVPISSATSATVAGHVPGTTYAYSVAAISTVGSFGDPAIVAFQYVDAVTGLTSQLGASGAVSLTWNTVAGASNYTVVRASPAWTWTTTSPSIGLAGHSAGRAYSYTVYAVSPSGAVGVGATTSFTYVESWGISVSAADGAGVVLFSWPAVNGAQSYVLTRTSNPPGTVSTTSDTSAAIPGHVAGASYSYVFYAVASDGRMVAYNPTYTFTYASLAAPTGSAVSYASNAISWRAAIPAEAASSYSLNRGATNLYSGATPQTGIVDTNLNASTAYTYSLLATVSPGYVLYAPANNVSITTRDYRFTQIIQSSSSPITFECTTPTAITNACWTYAPAGSSCPNDGVTGCDVTTWINFRVYATWPGPPESYPKISSLAPYCYYSSWPKYSGPNLYRVPCNGLGGYWRTEPDVIKRASNPTCDPSVVGWGKETYLRISYSCT